MALSTDDLEQAVLSIFMRLRIPMDGKLARATLIKEWSNTHLRYSDLSTALKRLTVRNVLKEEHARDDEILRLTPCGFSRVMELRRHQFRNWLRQLRLSLFLFLSREHPSRHSPYSHTH